MLHAVKCADSEPDNLLSHKSKNEKIGLWGRNKDANLGLGGCFLLFFCNFMSTSINRLIISKK